MQGPLVSSPKPKPSSSRQGFQSCDILTSQTLPGEGVWKGVHCSTLL